MLFDRRKRCVDLLLSKEAVTVKIVYRVDQVLGGDKLFVVDLKCDSFLREDNDIMLRYVVYMLGIKYVFNCGNRITVLVKGIWKFSYTLMIGNRPRSSVRVVYRAGEGLYPYYKDTASVDEYDVRHCSLTRR